MITQEKMYDIFFNNQDYIAYLTATHYKKAMPNEKTYSAMLSNSLYASYLKHINPKLKQREVLKSLNLFDDKFWLKKSPLNLILFLRKVKENKISVNLVFHFFTQNQLVNSLFNYLQILTTKTKINQKLISKC